jgi:hypothetical protein
MIPDQNRESKRLADLELEIVKLQRGEADRRKSDASIVWRTAFVLYIASAALAVYGKWLEVKYTKKTDTIEVDASETDETVR